MAVSYTHLDVYKRQGYKMLLALKSIPDCEIHLVISEGGIRNFRLETDLNIDKIKTLADYYLSLIHI